MGSLHPLQLLAYLAVLTLGVPHALAADSFGKGGSIKDGETLVSAGGVFELGFFSPGRSAGRYLGIWYKKIPVHTVVSVFNRASPLADASGVLTLDDDGNLMLLNGRGSSLLLGSSGAGEAPVAELLDTGNFVLAAASNRSLITWQSFEHPTDTLLPGMRLGWQGQQNRLLTSWRNPDDPTPGDFEFGVDPNRTAQLFLWQRGNEYWTSGRWNGARFSSAPEMTRVVNHNFYSYVTNDRVKYFMFSIGNASASRFVMKYDGQITQWVWQENTRAWASLWSYPTRGYLCEFPSACGANGLCYNGSSPSCSCLRGFVPGRNLEWDSGDWSGSCERRTPVTCGEGDGFLVVQKVKLPVTFLRSRTFDNARVDVDSCRVQCAMNCSCSAYASVYGNGTGCVLWFGDLIGLQRDDNAVQDLYVRVAASALGKQRPRNPDPLSTLVEEALAVERRISPFLQKNSSTKL